MNRFFFPTFRWLYRFTKLRHRFSSMGIFLWMALLFSAALGIDTKATMLHQLFMFLVSLFLVSLTYLAVRRFHTQALKVHRQLPSWVTVGVSFQYHLSIQNNENRSLYHIQIREDIQSPEPSFQAFVQAQEPDEHTRNRFDRDIGYTRYIWLQQQQRGLDSKYHDIASISPQENIHISMQAKAIRRGIIYFNDIVCRQTDPLGLLFQQHRTHINDQLLALPRRYRLPVNISMMGTHPNQQGNTLLRPNSGNSDEFHTLREYQRSDSPRHIHWPSWAKKNQPMVKQFQDEQATQQALILDHFSCDMVKKHPQILEEAISVAASFSAPLNSELSLVDLVLLGSGDSHQTQIGRCLTHAEQMLESLATVSLCHEQSFTVFTEFVMQQTSQLHTCILVLIDWDKSRKDLVKQLQAASINLIILIIVPSIKNHAAAQDNLLFSQTIKYLRLNHIQQDIMQ